MTCFIRAARLFGSAKPQAAVFAVFVALAWGGVVQGRTITLTAEDCDQMAVMSAKAPKLGWAVVLGAPKVHNCEHQLHFFSDSTMLMKFNFDKIPKDARVTKAELSMQITYMAGAKIELNVRRVTAEWGVGVCHTHRMRYPKEIEWAQPGARGAGTDRATKISGIFTFAKVGDGTIDVTEDVDLWLTGGVANRGWVFSLEPAGGVFYGPSPYSPHDAGPKAWKLQITYERQ